MTPCPYVDDGCDYTTSGDDDDLTDHLVKWHGEEEEYDDEEWF